MLKITLTKSTISETPRNRATVHALGLRKTNRSVLQEDNPVIQGMIHHVKHLVKVEDVGDQVKTRKRLGKKAASAAPAAPKKAPAPASSAAAPEAAAPAAEKPAAAKKPAATAKKTTTKKKDS